MERSQRLSQIRRLWSRYHDVVLYTVIAPVTLLGALRFLHEWQRLLFKTDLNGARDLLLRHGEIERWFAGLPVYTGPGHAGYPPASYALLYPFFGWLGGWETRWLWGLVTLVELSVLVLVMVKQSGAQTRLERALIATALLTTYPIPITIGNGQLGVHALVAFLGGLFLVTRKLPVDWRSDVLAALLWLLALTKPSFIVPFFWLALILPGRLRPIVLVGLGYGALTFFAAAFQPEPLPQLFRELFTCNKEMSNHHLGAHLPHWLGLLGLQELATGVSLLLFLALGGWVCRRRHVDVWLLLGAAGIVARLWSYHRMYDDMLMLPAMIALFRIVKRGAATAGVDVLAGILFGAGWLLLHAPGKMVNYPFPLNVPYHLGNPALWLATLVFFLVYSRRAAASL